MAEAERVSARQRAILMAVVESYIETGEPVGSATLSRLHVGEGVSPATIRNDMAALAEEGLLEQPHTSAGRVPTGRAFRMYVETLTGGSRPRVDVRRLPEEAKRQIESSFAGVAGTEALLERTSHVLARLSSGVGVAIAAAGEGDLLEHVHFSRLAERRVLAVVVTRSGMVQDRVLGLDRDLSVVELETAANFLNENFRGWTVEKVRAEITRRLEQERNEYQRLLDAVQQLWTKALPENGLQAQTVYVEGVGNLLASQPMGSEEDRDKLRELLSAVETKQKMVELLTAYVDARQSTVKVVFELERQAPELGGLVLITASARMAGDGRGTVAVLGPKRMQYEKTMNTVGYIAQMFDRMVHPMK